MRARAIGWLAAVGTACAWQALTATSNRAAALCTACAALCLGAVVLLIANRRPRP